MRRESAQIICIIVLLTFLPDNLFCQVTGFDKIHWSRERIAPGLTWKSAHTFLNDSVPHNINILFVNTRKRKVSLYYEPGRNTVLSNQAEKAGAIAAVNGGFFNIKDGGSVTYIRTGGMITDSDTAKKWTRNSNMTGSFLIDKNGHITIDRSYGNHWYDGHQEFSEVLVTGPILLKEKSRQQLPATTLVMNKHPRTAVGLKGRHTLIIITLDGRTAQARGMTLSELTDLMMRLHCKDALNFDGGGSTTMWITGKPFNGVVNMPSDNKKFDHEGERAVSDILIIR